MCGIVGYIGSQDAFSILINGLKRLEYRGYDSAGIAVINDETAVYKCKGKVSDLEFFLKNKKTTGTIGMGHTRWATHGEPNNINAHPHTSESGNFIIIHNGIIENYSTIKKNLISKGVNFESETDTEVLANLIEHFYLQGIVGAELAVRLALERVAGAYGILVICKDEPDKVIAARKGSPLVIGVGKGEYFIASDATPIVEYTKDVIFLNDNDVAVIKKDEMIMKTLKNEPLIPKVQKIDLDIGEIDKGGYDHFMLKEIFEQPQSIMDTFRGRILPDKSGFVLGGLHEVMPELIEAKKIIIIACGTSWHAALAGEYLFEEFARIPVEVEYASEFRYRDPILEEGDVIIAISQSGETADTLAAIKQAKNSGVKVLGICNVVGSSISRETDAGVFTHAGPEIGVASTKAFTAQITVLTMMALLLGNKKDVLNNKKYISFVKELAKVPEKIEIILKQNNKIKEIAQKFKDSNNCLYLGRGYNFPVALEGALKLKEISYIHAEGYPAAEMKHGPIALIDECMPVFVVATKDKSYEKIASNIQEIKARKGVVVAIVTKGDKIIKAMADYIIEIPEAEPSITAILSVIPFQLLAYYIAILRGCHVDQPRNLAKSVTVE